MTPAMRRAQEQHEREEAIRALMGLFALIENAGECFTPGTFKLILSERWKKNALTHLPRAIELLQEDGRLTAYVEEAHPVFKDASKAPLRMLGGVK